MNIKVCHLLIRLGQPDMSSIGHKQLAEEMVTREFLPTTDQGVDAAEEGIAGLESWSEEIVRVITGHIAWLRTNSMHWQSLQPHFLLKLGPRKLAASSMVWMTVQALNQARGQTSAQSAPLPHPLHPLIRLMLRVGPVIWRRKFRIIVTYSGAFYNKGENNVNGWKDTLEFWGEWATRRLDNEPLLRDVLNQD